MVGAAGTATTEPLNVASCSEIWMVRAEPVAAHPGCSCGQTAIGLDATEFVEPLAFLRSDDSLMPVHQSLQQPVHPLEQISLIRANSVQSALRLGVHSSRQLSDCADAIGLSLELGDVQRNPVLNDIAGRGEVANATAQQDGSL